MGYGLAVGYIIELTTAHFNLGDLTDLVGTRNAKLDILSAKQLIRSKWSYIYIFLGASSKRKSSLPMLGKGVIFQGRLMRKPPGRIRQIRQTRLARVKHL